MSNAIANLQRVIRWREKVQRRAGLDRDTGRCSIPAATKGRPETETLFQSFRQAWRCGYHNRRFSISSVQIVVSASSYRSGILTLAA